MLRLDSRCDRDDPRKGDDSVHGRLRRAVRAQTHIGHVRKDLARTIDLTPIKKAGVRH